MNTTEGIKVIKHTQDFIKCSSCLYPNNFIISAAKEGDLYYYITTCPRCGHHEECKLVSYRVAKEYLDIPLLDELK